MYYYDHAGSHRYVLSARYLTDVMDILIPMEAGGGPNKQNFDALHGKNDFMKQVCERMEYLLNDEDYRVYCNGDLFCVSTGAARVVNNLPRLPARPLIRPPDNCVSLSANPTVRRVRLTANAKPLDRPSCIIIYSDRHVGREGVVGVGGCERCSGVGLECGAWGVWAGGRLKN